MSPKGSKVVPRIALEATAIVAAIGSGVLPSARAGNLLPSSGLFRDSTRSGGKTRLLGISKRGNSYLRKLLIHGARAAVVRMKRETCTIRRLAEPVGKKSAAQRHRYLKQTRPDRMGCAVQWRSVQARQLNYGRLSKHTRLRRTGHLPALRNEINLIHRGLHR